MLPNSGRRPAARRLRAANIVTGMHSSRRARGPQTRYAPFIFPTYHLRPLSSPSRSFFMIFLRGRLYASGLVVVILAANCLAVPAHLSTSESSLVQPLERRDRSGLSGAAVAGITVGGVLLLAVVFIIVRGCVQRRCVNLSRAAWKLATHAKNMYSMLGSGSAPPAGCLGCSCDCNCCHCDGLCNGNPENCCSCSFC